jgi:preprotein translocase subunit SecF
MVADGQSRKKSRARKRKLVVVLVTGVLAGILAQIFVAFAVLVRIAREQEGFTPEV